MDRIIPSKSRREPWSKGRRVSQKTPLKLKDIWLSECVYKSRTGRRDLAPFNLAIDSKLRACDLVLFIRVSYLCKIASSLTVSGRTLARRVGRITLTRLLNGRQHQAKADVGCADRCFSLASATGPIAHAVLIGAQKRSALLHPLRHSGICGIIAIGGAMWIAYYCAIRGEHLIVVGAIPVRGPLPDVAAHTAQAIAVYWK